jgi:hypothetical protein
MGNQVRLYLFGKHRASVSIDNPENGNDQKEKEPFCDGIRMKLNKHKKARC